MVRLTVFFLLGMLAHVFYGCGPSKTEVKALETCSAEYKQYVFTAQGDYYLKIRLQTDAVDTTEIQAVFEYSILVKNRNGFATFRKDVSWKYLNIYNKDGEFLFRLGKDVYGSGKFFFKMNEYD
jgi:hypothetical protein